MENQDYEIPIARGLTRPAFSAGIPFDIATVLIGGTLMLMICLKDWIGGPLIGLTLYLVFYKMCQRDPDIFGIICRHFKVNQYYER